MGGSTLFEFDPGVEQRRAYGFAKAGFSILSLALVTAGMRLCYEIWSIFHFQQPAVPNRSWVDLGFSTFIDVSCLVGFYFLWKTSSDLIWRRRAGALVVMGLIDMGLWAVQYRRELATLIGYYDVPPPDKEYAWLRQQIAFGLGWFELIWTSGLAWSLLAHYHSLLKGEGLAKKSNAVIDDWEEPSRGFQIPYAESMLGNGSIVLARAGLVEWIIVCIMFSDWSHWPIKWAFGAACSISSSLPSLASTSSSPLCC